eukprot:CAMPEP_0177450934 /NCGR_PEP_ID=MMETSP0369-20130122/9494_1 /TAXON_ID=447022 ORGANISM="Scrippsiella hangoei-like, Strain SHHI-4" /NCGR_SAMPLE_ID=MMETSP0369 /ASSEMBLY_ACC=CAM_ASM_000364 /LENGTH=438 /DNA_ID=CAMNT_0018923483 /DNA_START=280 /DNA_END=1597 /DNA_ORIENTATION=-
MLCSQLPLARTVVWSLLPQLVMPGFSGPTLATASKYWKAIAAVELGWLWAVVTASSDRSARVWSPLGWECVQAIEVSASFAVRSAAFGPDGCNIITACDIGVAQLWSADSGECIQTFAEQRQGVRVRGAALHPGGRLVLTIAGPCAQLWLHDAALGGPARALEGHSGDVLAATFSADGSHVATASRDGTAKVWNTESGACLSTFRACGGGRVLSVAFDPSGARVALATSRGSVAVWQAFAGKNRLEAGEAEPVFCWTAHSAEVCCVAFSPDGATLATASGDGTAMLWCSDGGSQLQTFSGHRARVRSVAFGLDGHGFVTGSDDKTAKLWCLDSGRCVRSLRGHRAEVVGATFSPVAKAIVTASMDGTVRLWSAVAWETVRTFRLDSNVLCAGFSPNSQAIVTALKDGTARVWSVEAGRCMRILRGHDGPVRSAAFSPA